MEPSGSSSELGTRQSGSGGIGEIRLNGGEQTADEGLDQEYLDQDAGDAGDF
jgi:hypothetical protein